MNRFIVFVLLIITAPLFSALYGIIHDQITYSISEEYYTKFKFIQFNLDKNPYIEGNNVGEEGKPEIILKHPRLGVSIVGVLATWWVGLIVGILIGFFALIYKDSWRMFNKGAKAFIITLTFSAVSGVIGWLYGFLYLVKNKPNWDYPANLIDVDHFIIVGSIHNFGYIGAVVGLVAAIVFMFVSRNKMDVPE